MKSITINKIFKLITSQTGIQLLPGAYLMGSCLAQYSPANSRFVGIVEKESTKKLAQRMKKFLSPQQFKLSKAERNFRVP